MMATKKKADKRSTLDLAINAVSKKHGHVIQWLSDTPDERIEFIPTGSVSLDYALGGGFPRGRIVEIFGWESSGKSTLAMSVAAEANRMGLRCLYIDAERALDKRLPVSYGVDPNKFILQDPPITAEEHFSIMTDLVSSGGIGVCVVDSVSSLVPKAVMEGDIGASHVGQLARFLSQECTKLVHLLGETNTLFIFINQYREKIMKMPGDPRTTSGGNAIRFYATHRVEVAGTGKTKSGAILDLKGNTIGHKMKFKVLKNKVGVPYRSGGIDLIYGQGYDTFGELVELAADFGLIEKSGSWLTYKEDQEGQIKVQGIENMKMRIAEDTALRCSLLCEVKEVLGMPLTVKELEECNHGVVEEHE
jgi:recombination protein RecA